MTTRHAYASTSLGELLLVADDGAGPVGDTGAGAGTGTDALIGVYFEGHWYPPTAEEIGERVDPAEDALLARTARQLREYLAGERREFDLPLRTSSDATSQRVWQRLRQIPYGETTTYGAIALELGNRNLAQRVGQAVGHNPISIIIPCHRVLGADGSLTGFAGGLDRKRALLDLEEPEPSSVGRLF